MTRPKGWPTYKELEGRKFRLLREFATKGGDIFPAGTVLEAGYSRNWVKMLLVSTTPCPCGLHHSLRGISPYDVELLPEGT